MKRFLAGLVDAALNKYAPIVQARSYAFLTDVKGDADLLAEAEAETEVWEPEPLLPWEQELLDATTMTDEQWAAHYLLDLPKDQTADEFVAANPDLFTDQPAGAVASPPTASGPGGFPNHVAHVIAVVLRGQGIHSAPIYADLIARELACHFDITPK